METFEFRSPLSTIGICFVSFRSLDLKQPLQISICLIFTSHWVLKSRMRKHINIQAPDVVRQITDTVREHTTVPRWAAWLPIINRSDSRRLDSNTGCSCARCYRYSRSPSPAPACSRHYQSSDYIGVRGQWGRHHYCSTGHYFFNGSVERFHEIMWTILRFPELICHVVGGCDESLYELLDGPGNKLHSGAKV